MLLEGTNPPLYQQKQKKHKVKEEKLVAANKSFLPFHELTTVCLNWIIPRSQRFLPKLFIFPYFFIVLHVLTEFPPQIIYLFILIISILLTPLSLTIFYTLFYFNFYILYYYNN